MRFSEFKEEWKKDKLSSLLKVKNGKDQKPYERIGSSIPVYGTGGVIGYVDRPIFTKDSIGIGRKGTIDKPVLLKYPFWTVDTLFYTDISYNVDSMFVYYLMTTINWKKLNQSTGVPSLTSKIIENVDVDFPNKEEQMKIASIFTKIDERIETQKKIIEDKNRLQKAMINFEIGLKCSSSSFKKTLFKETYEKAKEGGTPSTKENENYMNGTIPFLQIDDLCTKYITNTKRFITKRGMNNSSAWLVPENNIILSNGASVGQSAINMIPLCTKQGILGIIPKSKEISVEWLYYFLNTAYFKKELKRITTTGTFDAAYIKDIGKISLYIPSINEQNGASNRIKRFYYSIENEKDALHRLIKLKFYLLSNLFI